MKKQQVMALLLSSTLTIANVTPALAADISNSGIVITGGGALLYGIDRRIQDRTGIQVRIADEPTSCVAIGTGKALNELESLESNSLNRRAPYL